MTPLRAAHRGGPSPTRSTERGERVRTAQAAHDTASERPPGQDYFRDAPVRRVPAAQDPFSEPHLARGTFRYLGSEQCKQPRTPSARAIWRGVPSGAVEGWPTQSPCCQRAQRSHCSHSPEKSFGAWSMLVAPQKHLTTSSSSLTLTAGFSGSSLTLTRGFSTCGRVQATALSRVLSQHCFAKQMLPCRHWLPPISSVQKAHARLPLVAVTQQLLASAVSAEVRRGRVPDLLTSSAGRRGPLKRLAQRQARSSTVLPSPCTWTTLYKCPV